MSKITFRLMTGFIVGFLNWGRFSATNQRLFSIYLGFISIEIYPKGKQWFGVQNDWVKSKFCA